jgi:hypothetical protein
MRYSEEKIKEAILHPDLDVRDTALRYFYSSTRPDPALMSVAIQAIERYGRTRAFSFTHYLNLLPQTDQTITWVIAELGRDADGRPEEQYFYYLNLSRLLWHADLPLVASKAPEILAAPHFDPTEKPAFRDRLELADWNAERCWQALRHLCDVGRDQKDIEEFPWGHALRIVEALARQPHDYGGQVVALLSEHVHDFRRDPRKWLQPLLAKLAGEMQLQPAIPVLVANLGHPYSLLADQSMFALADIGTDDVVAAVCDRFPDGSRDFRLWASDLLGKIHLDVTVQRVRELLPGEANPAIRLHLCEALLDHFSLEGVEPARQLLRQQELTPDLRHLRSHLITTCKFMGIRFPEFDAWQEAAEKDAEENRAMMQEIEKLAFEARGDVGLLVQKLKAQVAEKQAERQRLEAEVAEAERLLRNRQAGAEGRSPGKPDRIGRNDPCPCGSGKKFKKCCMRT